MVDLTILLSVTTGLGAILSIVFAILAFARNKSKDASEITERLAKIETDILYIRQGLDDHKTWEHDIEQRVRALETNKK